MKKQTKELNELDADLFSGLSPVPEFKKVPDLNNEIPWKEPGGHAYDGSTLHNAHFDPCESVTPEQAAIIEKQVKQKPTMLDRALNTGMDRDDNPLGASIMIPMGMPADAKNIIDNFHKTGYILVDKPNNTIHLVILGEPKAQKRHRSVNIKGLGVRQYDPSAGSKKDLLHIVQEQAPKEPFNCPINLKVDFYFTRPKSHFKTGKNAHVLKDSCPTWHLSKPDADNCFKMISDALNKVFWRDDSLICQAVINKRYDLNPRIEVFITPLT